jgi:hypothetical protein
MYNQASASACQSSLIQEVRRNTESLSYKGKRLCTTWTEAKRKFRTKKWRKVKWNFWCVRLGFEANCLPLEVNGYGEVHGKLPELKHLQH